MIDGEEVRVRQLVSDGVGVNTPDDNGWTPLHFATQDWNERLCRVLLDAGANPNLQDSHGNTPLWRATFSSRGRGEVLTLLREFGADPLLKNKSGVSPVSLARTIGDVDVAQFYADVDDSAELEFVARRCPTK